MLFMMNLELLGMAIFPFVYVRFKVQLKYQEKLGKIMTGKKLAIRVMM